MVEAKDDLETILSVLSTSIGSAPPVDDESGNGRVVDDPIKEIPLIAADTSSDCCSDRRATDQIKNILDDMECKEHYNLNDLPSKITIFFNSSQFWIFSS